MAVATEVRVLAEHAIRSGNSSAGRKSAAATKRTGRPTAVGAWHHGQTRRSNTRCKKRDNSVAVDHFAELCAIEIAQTERPCEAQIDLAASSLCGSPLNSQRRWAVSCGDETIDKEK